VTSRFCLLVIIIIIKTLFLTFLTFFLNNVAKSCRIVRHNVSKYKYKNDGKLLDVDKWRDDLMSLVLLTSKWARQTTVWRSSSLAWRTRGQTGVYFSKIVRSAQQINYSFDARVVTHSVAIRDLYDKVVHVPAKGLIIVKRRTKI